MPTYEYECQKCKRRHDVFQSITARPLRTCPKCKGRLKRLMMGSGGGFLFKGSGFYITDNRTKTYQDAKRKDQAAAKPAPAPKPSAGGSGASS